MKQSVLVIGLGRFGSAAALELMELGHEVLAVDIDEAVVNGIAPDVTHAAQLDASDEKALKAVGAAEFSLAIVAISSATEASIFATMALRNLGVNSIVAKAATELHGAILARVGADRVVYAERETGQRVAHSLSIPNVIDYLDVAPRFGLAKIRPAAPWVGKTIKDIDLSGRLTISLIALRRGSEVLVNPQRDTVIAAKDELIVLGLDDKLERMVSEG